MNEQQQAGFSGGQIALVVVGSVVVIGGAVGSVALLVWVVKRLTK